MLELNRRHVLAGAAGTLGTVGAGLLPALAPPGAAAPRLPAPVPLDGRPLPAFDFSRASKLPREMTGYWSKAFSTSAGARRATVYLPRETPIRSYYTVIAAPQGMTTERFLQTSGWRDLADEKDEGLFVLEPGPLGWGDVGSELDYVTQAMAFYQSNGYFSIFGEHYLVGYGHGGAALEAWAVRHPLRVISQAYVESPGLPAGLLAEQGARTFDGTTEGSYTDVVLPPGFDLVSHAETVLPTWYVNPDRRRARFSIAYWRQANDTRGARGDAVLGTVYEQSPRSDRWMTSWSGPIAKVAVLDRPVPAVSRRTTRQIDRFLTEYTRYENSFAYGNQLMERADYRRLGIEVRTMVVDGQVREYLVHVPRSARRLWGDRAPLLVVWPGNTQTAKVFLDASGWWQVAEQEGFIMAIVSEQYSASPISVSHADSVAFFHQLRRVLLRQYGVDETRIYSTGQSAGSMLTQRFAAAYPEWFAAVASTSGAAAPTPDGRIPIEGVDLPASGQPIPNYLVYGYGDLANLEGDLWDDTTNTLDEWAAYQLGTHGFSLADVSPEDAEVHGFHDRFRTWTWDRRVGRTTVPLVKVTKNLFRSHNMIPEEMPLLWEFLRHFSSHVDAAGRVTRYYSGSGFRRRGDAIRI